MKELLTLFTLLLTVCSGAWAYDGASGDVSFIKINGGGKANKMATGCYYYRPSSGYSWSDGNGVKTSGNTSSVIFYIDKTTDVTVDIKHTESKNAHTVTASVYSLTESAYSAFSSITSETAVTFSLPGSASTSFDIDITASTETFTGTKQLTAGYYAIVCTGDSNDKGKAFFNAIHFAAVDSRPAAPISWSEASALATIDESNTYPTLTNTNDLTVSYSSSNTSVASFADAATYAITLNAVGKTNITATYTTTGPSDTYKTTKVSYELTVTNLVPQSNKFWKFTDTAWSSYTPQSKNNKVDNLEIITNDASHMTLVDQNYTINGVEFTKGMNTGGSSTSARRTLHFIVAANSMVTAYVRPNGSDRSVIISNESWNNTSDQAKLTDASSSEGHTLSLINEEGGEVFIHGTNNFTIYGIKVTPAHTVTYALNGGTGTLPTESKKGTGDVFTLHDGTTDITAPDGKEFDGWSDGTSTYAGGAEYTMPDDDVILTAQWRTPAVKYHVTYELNGGTGTTPTQADTEEGGSFTLHDGITDITAPDGKKFVAWNDGTKNYDGGAEYTMPGENVTLTAQWADKYTITVRNTENGTITASATEAVAGEEITLTATPDFKYVLGSWMVYKTFDTTTSTYVNSNNKFIMPAYNVTVDATFVADSRKQILYLTTTAKETTEANDKLYAALNSVDDYNVIIEAPASQTLTNYDLIVLHESIGGTSEATAVTGCKTTTTPVLNTKSYFYGADGDASKRWQWGAPNAGTSAKGATLNTAFSNIASHPIFAGVTISTNFFEITDEAAEKCMQPVGSFVAGKEGFTLATTPNKSTGDGAAIHELTPAQRGADSGKYLLISVSSAKLNALNENGQLLFKNAAAYLLSNDQWVPTVPVEVSTLGYATFASDKALDFTDKSIKAYKATVTGTTVNFTQVDVVPAGEGVLLYANGGASIDVPVATDAAATAAADDFTGNKLVRGTGASLTYGNGAEYYILSNEAAGVGFYKANGNVVSENKAYLDLTNTNAKSFALPGGETDGIRSIENGKLRIENSDYYNLAGQRVGKDYKGIIA